MTLVATEEVPGGERCRPGLVNSQGTRMVLDIVGLEDAPSGSVLRDLDDRSTTVVTSRPAPSKAPAGLPPSPVSGEPTIRGSGSPWRSADHDLGPSRETYFDTA